MLRRVRNGARLVGWHSSDAVNWWGIFSLQQSVYPCPERLIFQMCSSCCLIASGQWAAGGACVQMCSTQSHPPRQLDGVSVIKSHISQMTTSHEAEDHSTESGIRWLLFPENIPESVAGMVTGRGGLWAPAQPTTALSVLASPLT